MNASDEKIHELWKLSKSNTIPTHRVSTKLLYNFVDLFWIYYMRTNMVEHATKRKTNIFYLISAQ